MNVSHVNVFVVVVAEINAVSFYRHYEAPVLIDFFLSSVNFSESVFIRLDLSGAGVLYSSECSSFKNHSEKYC